MTIQEAVKSNKKFKRESDRVWMECDEKMLGYIRIIFANEKPFANLSRADILAEDWEVAL